jgi:hypothetical protein
LQALGGTGDIAFGEEDVESDEQVEVRPHVCCCLPR